MRRRLPPPRALLGWLLAAGGIALGLFATNPAPEAFAEFAAQRLSALIREELCHHDGLPLMLRLVIQDCPGLVESQRPLLGRLALLHTQRRNLLLFSLYRTELGGQTLRPDWRLPRYHALTLAAAGQFLVLRTSEVERSAEAPRQAWLPEGVW